MRTSPLVRKLLVLLATTGLLGAAVIAAPAVIGVVGTPCTSANLGSNPYQVTVPGLPNVTLTASSTGCGSPQYQFYLQPPGGAWTAKGAYSSTATYAWNTTGLAQGIWGIGVRARQSGTSVAYDAYFTGTYTLSTLCDGVSISAGTTSPATPGTNIVFTASAVGCSNPEFKFVALPPGGSWSTVRLYGPTTTFTWDTTGLTPGTWQIGVWARTTGSTKSYNAYALTTFVIRPFRCVDATLYLTPSPQSAGTPVTLSTVSTGCPNPEYEFWKLAPGGAWTIIRTYSTSTAFAWDTTGLANGRYQLGVWARQVGSPNSQDTYVIATYYIRT